jgi:hypothetical protein
MIYIYSEMDRHRFSMEESKIGNKRDPETILYKY